MQYGDDRGNSREQPESELHTYMSESKTDSSKTYRIATSVSTGLVEDPVTGEEVPINEGEFELSRPDSAHYIVQSQDHLEYLSDPPTEKAIKEAEQEALGFELSGLAYTFAKEKRAETIPQQTYDPKEGFDPKAGEIKNDTRLKIMKAYDALHEADRENEAEYLRALSSERLQSKFVDFLRDSPEVEVYL